MKGDTEVILMISFFVAGFVLALGLVESRDVVAVGDIVNPLATLIAAFVGAWSAFKLQTLHLNEEQKRSNIAAGNRAISTLMQQANTLKLFQNDFIAPVRDRPGKHFVMHPTLPYQEDSLPFDLRSLDFLTSPKHQQAIFELSIEESRYRESLKAINSRSRLHLEVIQPLLSRSGFTEGQPYTGEQFFNAVGEFNNAHLTNLTDAVIFHVDRTVESLCAMKDRLRKILKTVYPDGHFIDFELLDKPLEAHPD